MAKTEKAKQIVHEAEITRQHARYKIPATIEIEGKRYKVYDWSVSGVGIIGLPKEIYEKKHVTAKMIFRFDDFETVIDNLQLEFVNVRPDGVTGARFTELTPQQIAILNQIISAYLAGDIITEDDIIHAVTRANFIEKKEQKTKIDKKKSIAVLVVLWSFILGLILFILYVMYQRIYLVKSENAYFDANMTIIRAPSPSYIEFAQPFKKGDKITIGEQLAFSHLIYGGVREIKSPLEGTIYNVYINNGDFRNVGEPIFAVLNKNYEIYIVANVLHKDLVKLKLGDIARVELPNGDRFYARLVKTEFPYNVLEQHARPLENVYNQARNYDKVILKPINYIPSDSLIGTSAVVVFDTFLNKHGWYSIEERHVVKKHKTEEAKREVVKPKEVKKVQPQQPQNQTALPPQYRPVKEAPVEVKPTQQSKQPQEEVRYVEKEVQKYCIIAASSPKMFTDEKSKTFLSKYPNATVEKYGNIYEIKVSAFDSYAQAKSFLNRNVRRYYKDAFIIKCKVKVKEKE